MKNIKYYWTDYLIIGTGIAGLYASLQLPGSGNVIILTKRQLLDSNTQQAQGGIAAVFSPEDSLDLHISDTIKAGAGLCFYDAVKLLVSEGPARVRDLISMGTNFDSVGGKPDLTRESAHSRKRILHARGDATGAEIRESLTRVVNNYDNISIKENNFMLDLLLNKNGEARGILSWDREREEYNIHLARVIILATGGCGQVYYQTSNPSVTTGDGVAVAYRAGAEIIDMEFMQFHPTTLYNPGGRSFLISETVRGEGGLLKNDQGRRFMPAYHKMAELAPRDIVARAILNEIEEGELPYIWLDVTHLDKTYLKERFPLIFATLMGYDIDMREDLIPIVPAAHYLMGGVRTDLNGRTNIPGLYACGEVACTGVHGANRLASNSLLEGLVFSYRISQDIRKRINQYKLVGSNSLQPFELLPPGRSEIDVEIIREKLRQGMSEYGGIKKDKTGLLKLIDWIEMKLRLVKREKVFNEELWETLNLLTVAQLIIKSALMRRESRGSLFRYDYPEPDKEWTNRHVVFSKSQPEGSYYEFA